MPEINFTKMNGAGNDFVLIDASKNVGVSLSENLILQICDRRKGIGADGVLFLKPSEKSDFELMYYNSNGKIGSLCGNGSRCAIKYALGNYSIKSDTVQFICGQEYYSGFITTDNLINFSMGSVREIELNCSVKLNDKNINSHFVNSGSPHLLVFWDEIKNITPFSFQNYNVIEYGRALRYSAEFAPDGTNVNFIKIKNNEIYIRTYERGVEDETLACGTGSVAAAVILNLIKNLKPPITINTFGDDQLIVDFHQIGEKFSKITLTGPAKINYIGSYNF